MSATGMQQCPSALCDIDVVHGHGTGEFYLPREKEKSVQVNVGPGGNMDLDNIFSHHPPQGDQIVAYERIRSAGKDLAIVIADLCPPSAERSTAIAKIREAVMWANASVACNPADGTVDQHLNKP